MTFAVDTATRKKRNDAPNEPLLNFAFAKYNGFDFLIMQYALIIRQHLFI